MSANIALQVFSSAIMLGDIGGMLAGTAFLATTSALGIMKDQKANAPEKLKEALLSSKESLTEEIFKSIANEYDGLLNKAISVIKEQQEEAILSFTERMNTIHSISQKDSEERQVLKTELEQQLQQFQDILDRVNVLRSQQVSSMELSV